eukprot:gene8208-biopygen1569
MDAGPRHETRHGTRHGRAPGRAPGRATGRATGSAPGRAPGRARDAPRDAPRDAAGNSRITARRNRGNWRRGRQNRKQIGAYGNRENAAPQAPPGSKNEEIAGA